MEFTEVLEKDYKTVVTEQVENGSTDGSRKHLLFINQHYYPDVAATGQYLTDLCEYLTNRGHEVTVLCSQGHYLSGRQDVEADEMRNGVHILRVPATSFGRASHYKRLIDYASFLLLTLWYSLFRITRPDTVVCLTTPPLLGLVGYLIRTFRKSDYMIWSMDLHPEAEKALGMLPPSRIFKKFLFRLGKFIYQKSDHVISLGPEMTRQVKNYPVEALRVSEIPIWADKEEIRYFAENDCVPDKIPRFPKNRFIVNYSGNVGLVHDLEALQDVMMALKNDPEIFFLFTGGGPQVGKLKKFVRTHQIRNVDFQDYVEREDLSCALARADLHWFSLKLSCSGIAVPSKSVGYMASGIPQLFLGDITADNAQTIRRAGCGYVVHPQKTEEAVAVIREMKDNADLRSEMGRHGRHYFENHLEKQLLCDRWHQLLTNTGVDVKVNL